MTPNRTACRIYPESIQPRAVSPNQPAATAAGLGQGRIGSLLGLRRIDLRRGILVGTPNIIP